MVPRLYKQGKTTELGSEKVTATSVRKAAGSQSSWFERKGKFKKWDWQLLLDHGMPPCDWGEAVTELLVRQDESKNHFALGSEHMSWYCYSTGILLLSQSCILQGIPGQVDMWHTLSTPRKIQETIHKLQTCWGRGRWPSCPQELCPGRGDGFPGKRTMVSRLHSIRDNQERVDQTFSEVLQRE